MVTLKERGKALENIYFHDEEATFRVQAMRNKLIGLWAAALMNKDDANSYANEVVSTSVEHNTPDAVFNKLHDDFAKAGIAVLDASIHERMSELLRCAVDDLRSGLSSYGTKMAS
ncbi:DUF1476 domain-containing protein [uncultured Agrobacterium sp.]|uniref:DUF1476 domain-containing protein n=1 Tax=uncultured Agrobacterium sp. TaxID=157277 RepID=UPI0025878C0A|nr:DUF1476 domain-containing protein [uncultured Agrobacterium sp.]